MTSEWKELTLNDVCLKITDAAHNSPKSVKDGKPMASVKDLTFFGVNLDSARHIDIEEFEKLVRQGCMPEVGDVLIAKDGNSALDTVCNIKSPLDVVMLSSVAILRPNKSLLESDFLKYYFRSKDTIAYLKNNFISGAAIPRVVLKDFKKVKINIPPITEQRKITKILNSLEDTIYVNYCRNRLLESITQTIFKSWFVDFDPVHAKKLTLEKGLTPKQAERAAMATISAVCSPASFSENFEEMDLKLEEKLSSMSKDRVKELEKTASLFPCEFEESKLGEIPKGWAYKTISDVTDLIIDHRGKTPKKMGGDWVTSGYPAISSKNIKRGKVIRRDMIRFLDDEIYHKWMKEEIKRGDIVMTSKAPMGELFYVADDTKYCLSQRLYAMRANKNIIPSSFLYCYLNSGAAMSEMEGRSTGTTVVGIKQSELRKVKVLVPTTDISKSYDEIVENILQMKNENESQIISLGDMRDTLLPKLLAGEINLDKIQIAEVLE